jgi:hypothetical protein
LAVKLVREYIRIEPNLFINISLFTTRSHRS